MLPNRLVRSVAEYMFSTLVPGGDNTVEILADDGVLRGFHNGRQPGLDLLAFGDLAF